MTIKNIFLTGELHVGKSTAIVNFLKNYITKPGEIAGFKTKEYYEDGHLKGYFIESQLSPVIYNISENIVGINSDFKSGKSCYGVPEVFEKKGVEILQESMRIPNSIILMDELGFFEKDAFQFITQVHKTLDSHHRVLGVLKDKKNDFLDSIATREDVKVIRVTLSNRDDVGQEINKYWK